MLDKLKLLGLFLAIPLVGYCVLGWVASKQEQEWRHLVQQKFKDVSTDRLNAISLNKICGNAELASRAEGVCSEYSQVQGFRQLSLLACLVSVTFPLLVMLAGWICKANRNLLLGIFTAGLYISNILVSLIVVMEGIVLMASIYYGESALVNRIHYGYIILFGIATFAGAFYILKGTFGLVKKASVGVVGRSLNAAEHPNVWQFVRELAQKTGAEPPHNLVVGLTPNFFVTEAEVRCVNGELTGRTMYISIPLCRILTIEELSGVIAHELGHFKGSDTKFSLKFYPIYRGALDSINNVAKAAAHSEKGAIALIPAIYMLGFFLECFSGAENKISREREFAADAVAADAAGAANIATALVKIVAFTDVWEHLEAVMQASLKKGTITIEDREYDAQRFFSNVSNVFLYMVANHAEPQALAGLDAKTIPHPTDSHPPLSTRLKALKETLPGVQSKALNISPEPPSSSVIDKLDSLELELSLIQQYLLNPEQEEKGRPEAISRS